jgi:hypothetical protein
MRRDDVDPSKLSHNYKSRIAYGTGATECGNGCVCIFCQAKRRKEKLKQPYVNLDVYFKENLKQRRSK